MWASQPQPCIVDTEADVDISCLFGDHIDLSDGDADELAAELEDDPELLKALATLQEAVAMEASYNAAQDEEEEEGIPATATVQSSWDAVDAPAEDMGEGGPAAMGDPLTVYHSVAFRNEISTCAKPGIGVRPSHELVDLIPGTRVPAYLETEDIQYVDEPNCIGCGLCSSLAPATFMVEDVTGCGNGRVFEQGATSREVLEQARDSCPTRCIHTVSFHELEALEKIRDLDDWRGRDWAGAKGRPEDNLRSGVLNSHCYGTHKRKGGSALDATDGLAAVVDGGDEQEHSCPQQGCYQCPAYFYALGSHEVDKMDDAQIQAQGRGQNPFYMARNEDEAAVREAWQNQQHEHAECKSVEL